MSGLTPLLSLITPDIAVDMGDQYLLDEAANMTTIDTQLGQIALNIKAIATGEVGIGTATPKTSLSFPSSSTGITLFSTADMVTNWQRLEVFIAANEAYVRAQRNGAGAQCALYLGGSRGTSYAAEADGTLNINSYNNKTIYLYPHGTGIVSLAGKMGFGPNDGAAVAPTADLKLFGYNKSVADDSYITLPSPTTNGFGMVSADAGATYTLFTLSAAGTCTLISNTADVVANADTDTKLCMGTAALQNPLLVKNRLGAAKIVNLIMFYD